MTHTDGTNAPGFQQRMSIILQELLKAVKTALNAASDSLGRITPPPDGQIQPLADVFRR